MEDRIKIEYRNGVADVRMVRADKMNALDDAMFAALLETGEKLKQQPGVRAVVLSGEGKAFCAGLDTGNFGKMASGERRSGSGLVDTPRTACGLLPAISVATISASLYGSAERRVAMPMWWASSPEKMRPV